MDSTSTPPFDLDTYLKGLSAPKRNELFNIFAYYPRTPTLPKDETQCICQYVCPGPVCYTQDAEKCAKESAAAKDFRMQSFVQHFLEDFVRFEDSMAASVDGFRLTRGGLNVVEFRRIKSRLESDGPTRTGVLEYNEVRTKAAEDAALARQMKLVEEAKKKWREEECVIL